ncbi:hypothetical protein DPX16_21932 [Anabarilius grahami]|uniref:Uncharacterized protein n=1 Tax=Anabarilius grahami TaxID=495550 RepID=A0A3N0XQ04_ANAGA|nr:hypothetical protein DPX16_21932 [Anabarilius grahami]
MVSWTVLGASESCYGVQTFCCQSEGRRDPEKYRILTHIGFSRHGREFAHHRHQTRISSQQIVCDGTTHEQPSQNKQTVVDHPEVLKVAASPRSLTELGNPVTQSLILTQIFLTQESERGEDVRGGTEEKNEKRIRTQDHPGRKTCFLRPPHPRLQAKNNLFLFSESGFPKPDK